jgi:exopolysaccharide production protein ExoZ
LSVVIILKFGPLANLFAKVQVLTEAVGATDKGIEVISNLQILRGLAALGVVFYHTNYRLPGDWHTEFFGVSTFFVISGFIMCLITRDPEGGDATSRGFMMRRAIRIVPFYWLCTFALIVLLNRPQITWHIDPIFAWASVNVPHLLRSLFFVPSETFPMLGVGWTLNFEVYFYVVFAFAILLSRTFAPVIAAAIVYAVFKASASGVDNWLIKFYSHGYIYFFLHGIALFYIWWFTKDHLKKSPIWIRLPVIVICGLIVVVVYGSQFIPPQPDLTTFVYFPVLLVAAAIFAASAGADINWGPLVLLGDASYAIYLTHTITIEKFRQNMPIFKDSGWSTLLIIIIATAVGILVHLYIEKPMLGWIRTRLWTPAKPESERTAALVKTKGHKSDDITIAASS